MPRDQTQTQPSLKEIFSQTETVEYSGLKVTKAFEADWKNSKAYANDQEIKLSKRQKQILALLISQQGQPLTKMHLRLNFDSYAPMDNYNLDNNYNVQISKLKAAVPKQLPEAAHIIDQIRSTNPARKKSQKGRYLAKDDELQGSYFIDKQDTPPVKAVEFYH